MGSDDEKPNVIPLPIHAAPRRADGTPLPVKRKPGRPRAVRKAPVGDELARQQLLQAELERHVARDPVHAATASRADSAQLAWALLAAAARECASIDFELKTGIISGPREVERARSRRIDCLVALAKLRLEVARFEAGDVPDHKIASVQALFTREIERVSHEVLPHDVAENLVRRFRAALDATAEGVDPSG